MEEWEILGNSSMITLIYHNDFDIALTVHPCLWCDQHIASPGVSRGQGRVNRVQCSLWPQSQPNLSSNIRTADSQTMQSKGVRQTAN